MKTYIDILIDLIEERYDKELAEKAREQRKREQDELRRLRALEKKQTGKKK